MTFGPDRIASKKSPMSKQHEQDRKRKKAEARRAAAALKRTAKLKAKRCEPMTPDGWKLPDKFMTGEHP